MKPLHIRHGLINSADTGRVANGAFGSVARLELDGAVGAAESNLVDVEFLGSAGMAGEDVGLIGDEEFDEVGAYVALAVGERFSIVGCGEEEGFAVGVVGVFSFNCHVGIAVVVIVGFVVNIKCTSLLSLEDLGELFLEETPAPPL